jgi:hypothetical protein
MQQRELLRRAKLSPADLQKPWQSGLRLEVNVWLKHANGRLARGAESARRAITETRVERARQEDLADGL